MLKTNVDFQHGYQVHIKSTFKSNVDLKYVLENVDLLCYYHLTKENANKCSFERGVNMKDVLIKARTLSTGKIVYEYRFEIASVDGKRKWKSKSGFKTKTEAREAGKLAQQAYEHVGQPIEPSNMSYADFLDQWLEMDCKLNCKASTLQGYEKKIRLYIKPALGEYRLKAITKNNLQDFITKMYNDGFSRNTISSVKGLLTKSFDFALDRHYITMTPATRLTIPTKMQPKNKTRTKKHVYIPQNIMNKIFERFPEGSSAYIPLIIGYHTGLRLGEIYALVWEDIDFKNNGIKIRRKGGYEAVIYFGEEVETALLDYLEQRNHIIPAEGNENALFLSLQNKRISVRAVEKLVKKYASLVTNLKKITPHKLRSTYGTSLYRETGDIYLVADVLGHKDVNTTRKHYAAIEDDRRRMAANVVRLRENKNED